MRRRKSILVAQVALTLGDPNTCPVCKQNWDKRRCRHIALTLKQLPANIQLKLGIEMLKRKDAL